MSPILQIKGVTKRYGGLTANNNILSLIHI